MTIYCHFVISKQAQFEQSCLTLLLDDIASQADILSVTENAVGSFSLTGLFLISFSFQLARMSDTGLDVSSGGSGTGADSLAWGAVFTSLAAVVNLLGVWETPLAGVLSVLGV